jgi:hypothetical protein
MQEESPAREYVPAGQVSGQPAVCPVKSENFPALQRVQDLVPCFEANLPFAQVVQAVAACSEYFPLSQSAHSVAEK